MRKSQPISPTGNYLGARAEHPNRLASETETVRQLGFWSAILSALFAVLWFVTYSLQDAIASVPDWRDVDAYAAAFTPLRYLYIYPSLLLAVTFIVLLACIHRFAPEAKRVWSLIGLALGIVYSVMATINYNIQAVAVRQSLLLGETQGISMFLPDNPHSVFTALANSYIYMALAMIFLAPIFTGGKLERWIRWLFLAQVLTVVGQVGWSMFGLSMGIFIMTSLVWVIGAPAAFILLAILFRRTPSQPATR